MQNVHFHASSVTCTRNNEVMLQEISNTIKTFNIHKIL